MAGVWEHMGYVTACSRGDPEGQGGFRPFTLTVLSPYPLKISPPPPNISDPWTEAAGAGSTGAQTSTVGFWILSLWNPQLEPPNPRPVFHSISPTITCNTRLRTGPTKARVDGNARVLKILGALLYTTPYINFSGLILSVHAELSLYSEVQYLMNVFWP